MLLRWHSSSGSYFFYPLCGVYGVQGTKFVLVLAMICRFSMSLVWAHIPKSELPCSFDLIVSSGGSYMFVPCIC